jgi:hypothetical protein
MLNFMIANLITEIGQMGINATNFVHRSFKSERR